MSNTAIQNDKGRLTPPICLFHVATQAEQDQYILIE